jgi:aminoglycoside phosphotransferase (APT) family kinase protein
MVNLEACLPAALQGPATTIDQITTGLSGAGVYKVESAGQQYVLKIAREGEPLAAWRRKLQLQQLAADAGLAPRVIHADEARRAVVSAFVADRSFPALFADPRTREAALALLGRTLRRLHQLPLPPGAEAQDPRELLAGLWPSLASFALPAFVEDAARGVLTEPPPARERALVLGHNDVNPTNLTYDGEHLLLLDWEAAGANDPFYDLGAAALFFRMDEATCLRLLSAYDGESISKLPARFAYSRRLVSVLCGATFLRLAQKGGHGGATGGETLDSTPSLGECVQRLRAGALNPATAEGQWWFGLALIRQGAAL